MKILRLRLEDVLTLMGPTLIREIEEEELDTGPGRNAEELLRSKKRLAAGVYDTCH